MTTTVPLSPMDAIWLVQESTSTPMHVASLQVFSSPPHAGPSYLQDLVDEWLHATRLAAPFNYRLRGSAPFHRWEVLPAEAVDLDYHLRHTALPGPGGEKELGAVVSRLHSTKLNRRFPLWECHVIEGLQDDRWALYTKVHHSLMDGVAALRIASRCLSTSPDARHLLPVWAVGNDGPDQSGLAPTIGSPLPREREEPLSALRSTGGVAKALSRAAARSILGPSEGSAAPFRNPSTVFNTRVDSPRRVATQQLELRRLRAVREATNASQNDVFLSICGGALRRYLTETDQLPTQSLSAVVPVSVRDPGSAAANAITFLLAHLGTDVADPVERLAHVGTSTVRAKRDLPRVGSRAMGIYTGLLMAPTFGQSLLPLGGRTPPMANIVLSNVPGLPQARYVNGSRLQAFYPISVLQHGQALNITAVSGSGTFDIGFTGGRDRVPHLQRIAVHCDDVLRELETALNLT